MHTCITKRRVELNTTELDLSVACQCVCASVCVRVCVCEIVTECVCVCVWQLQMAKYLNVTQFGMQYCPGKPLQQRLEAMRYGKSERERERKRRSAIARGKQRVCPAAAI